MFSTKFWKYHDSMASIVCKISCVGLVWLAIKITTRCDFHLIKLLVKSAKEMGLRSSLLCYFKTHIVTIGYQDFREHWCFIYVDRKHHKTIKLVVGQGLYLTVLCLNTLSLTKVESLGIWAGIFRENSGKNMAAKALPFCDGHKQVWYWLWILAGPLVFLMKGFSYLYHLNVYRW